MPIHKKVKVTNTQGTSLKLSPINVLQYVKKSNHTESIDVYNIYKKVNNKLRPVWGYEWEALPWEECSVSCGGGTQTRDVQCKRSDGIYKPDGYCVEAPKPIMQQTCNTQSCISIAGGCYVSGGREVDINTGYLQYKLCDGCSYSRVIGIFTPTEKVQHSVRTCWRVYGWCGNNALQFNADGTWRPAQVLCVYGDPISKYNSRVIASYNSVRTSYPNENRNGADWVIFHIPKEYITVGQTISIMTTSRHEKYKERTIYYGNCKGRNSSYKETSIYY